MRSSRSTRRGFLKTATVTAAGVAVPAWMARRAPAVIAAEAQRPQALQGLHFGDPADGAAVVWSRSDRPSRMLIDWSYDESFARARRIVGPHALDTTVVFSKAPPAGQSNLSPFSGLQFFGEVNIDAQGGDLTVDLRDINGVSVFSRTLSPRT